MQPQKPNKLFPEERRAAIVELLSMKPKVYVSDLMDLFGVSPFTIRGDLAELERAGSLQRTHGGAIPVSSATRAILYDQRLTQHSKAKSDIGQAAAKLVDDGDCLIVDTGTTTIELVRALKSKHDLTLITGDLEIASLAERELPNSQVFFLGGYIRHGHRYTNGTAVLRSLAPLHADKAFISTTGFTPEVGFSTETVEQSEIKSALARHARSCYVLMDTSKISIVSLSAFLQVSDVDGVITESALEPDLAARLQELNPDIHLMAARE